MKHLVGVVLICCLASATYADLLAAWEVTGVTASTVPVFTNTYTAAFFEEGMAVANVGGAAVKVSVALNVKGSSGFPAVGAGSGVTIA